MRINAIPNCTVSRSTTFNGHWEIQSINKYVNYPDPERVRKVYVPDENESVYNMAAAWKKETGLLPIDWVKENNLYNQSDSKVQYEIKGSPYLPVSVIRASAEMKDRNLPKYEHSKKIDKYIELAKLAAQTGDVDEVIYQESQMVNEMKKIMGAKYVLAAAMRMDNYKNKFGTDTMYQIHYNI